jgi:hypothetical protein
MVLYLYVVFAHYAFFAGSLPKSRYYQIPIIEKF